MATAPGVEKYIKVREDYEIDKLFRALVKLSGSDLHLKAERPPFIRVNGTLRPMNRRRSWTRRWCGSAFRC